MCNTCSSQVQRSTAVGTKGQLLNQPGSQSAEAKGCLPKTDAVVTVTFAFVSSYK